MNVKQMPLPGFESETIAEKLPDVVLLLLAHIALRDQMRELFDHEIQVLRIMGRMNAHECSDSMYLAQRMLCSAIKEVVIKLDMLNDATTKDDRNE